jgi:hypothetical protein
LAEASQILAVSRRSKQVRRIESEQRSSRKTEGMKMKKFLAAVGLMTGLMVLAGTAMAANPATFTLRVTPGVTRDVTLSSALYDFGTISIGGSTITPTAVTVTNSGNVTETFALRTSNSANWAPGAAAGADVFHLSALFHSSLPVAGNFGAEDDVLNVAAPGTLADNATVYTISGAYNGAGVNATSSRDLYFKLDMPTSTTSSAQQDINVLVAAQ